MDLLQHFDNICNRPAIVQSVVKQPASTWSADSCRQRVHNLMSTVGDALIFWQQATVWYAKQSEQGDVQEQRSAACWETLCTAWDELGGDDWANAQKDEQPDIVTYAVNLFDGKLIAPTQP